MTTPAGPAPPPPGRAENTGSRRRGAVLEGRYRLDGVLARGGMSVVHRGMDLRLDRPVAVKVMDRTLAGDPAFVRRFEFEARAAARLAHPGVVAVHDQGRDGDGTIFLVLELVEGGTLRDVLRERGVLEPATALTVTEQVVTALQVAHRHGLVHRDVKPENVLISSEGVVKVADFGLVGAATSRPGDDAEPEGVLLGTAAYLSPEQIADGHADARSDLYATGIVLFELLTGAPPFTGDTAAVIARRHLEQDVPPPSVWVTGIPRALDRLVLSLTGRDPADRLSDAAAFLTAARQVRVAAELPYQPVSPPRTRAAVPPPSRPLTGTRLLDLDEPAGARRHAPRDDPRHDVHDDLDDLDDLDDGSGPLPDADPADEPPDEAPRRRDRPLDDVDDRIERLERRRARARVRRLVAVWVLVVLVLTVASATIGWHLGMWSLGLPKS